MRARRPFMKRPWRLLAMRWLWRRRLSRPGNQPLALVAAANLTFGLAAKVSWRSQCISRSSQKIGQRLMRSTARHSLRAERTMDPLAFACTTIRIITVLLCLIPMDTTSRQFVTRRLSVGGDSACSPSACFRPVGPTVVWRPAVLRAAAPEMLLTGEGQPTRAIKASLLCQRAIGHSVVSITAHAMQSMGIRGFVTRNREKERAYAHGQRPRYAHGHP